MINKGFTLVELLIVVAILAILSTATVLILNPAQILQETRDTQRINDLGAVSSAISLYLATAAAPTFTTAFNCTVGVAPHAGDTGTCVTNAVRTTTGTAGWVNFDLSLSSGGSPLAVLPLDPTQSATLFYVFRVDGTTSKFELNANMESAAKAALYEGSDGGDNAGAYEIGTDPSLDLI